MDSLAGLVKQSIEGWADELRNSPLRAVAESGGITPRALGTYLASLGYLFTHSERNLHAAATRSKELGMDALAEYFERRTCEENGHAVWAANDIDRLPIDTATRVRPADTVLKIASLQRQLIEKHPFCFVVYAVVVEYLTVLLGDEWIGALASSGYDRSQLSAVANHFEADRGHATRGFSELDALWQPGQPDVKVVLQTVQETKHLFDAFCAEILAVAREAA